jgi:hypothetical protein
MANELYIYTTPPDTTVSLKLDLGEWLIGVPGTYNGRADGHQFQIPPGTTPQGALLTIAHDGYLTFENRGYLVPDEQGEAFWNCNDVHLVEVPTTPPPQPPPVGSTPLEIINGVYASGSYNLATKPGCGTFTEEVARQLAAAFGPMWGHVAKTPGQNQYNAHAVDAVHSLAGTDHGIWDIITSSVSSSAKPAFNRAGDSEPEIWRPPAPLPCVPAGTATRDVAVTLTVTLEDLIHLLAGLRVI